MSTLDHAGALSWGRWYQRPGVWVLAITLLAFVLRTLRLDLQPLWWDEGWSVYFATTDTGTMLARTAIDIHPPFYYFLLHLWIHFGGSGALAIRLLSAVTGTLSVPLLFMVGRRLFGTRTGLMASLTIAVGPFHIYYSQEARMYALVTLLVLASVYVFLSLLGRAAQGSPSPLLWLLYVVVTSLAVYTQYYAAFVPISQTIFVLVLFRRRWSLLVKWLGAQLLVLIAYLPWLLYAGDKLAAYVSTKLVKEGDVPAGPWDYVQQHLLAFSVGHVSESRTFLSWLAVISFLLVVLGIVARLRRRAGPGPEGFRPTEAVGFTLVYLLVPLCLGYLVNLRYPFSSPGIERLFLLSVPAFYLLVALGLVLMWEGLRTAWPACLLVLVVNSPAMFDLFTVERYVGEDYRPLVETVQTLARPDDVIVAVHPWQVGYFRSYYRGQPPSVYLTPKEATDVTSEEWAADPGRMAEELDDLLATHRLLWFPAHQALGRILESDIESYLSQVHYPLLSEWFSESTRLSCYTAHADLPLVESGANFGNKLSLLSRALSPSPVEAAWGAVLTELRWKVVGDLDGRYQVSMRLTDEKGRVWASRDSEPVAGLRPFHEQAVGSEIADQQGLLIPAGTPPGSYQLRMGVYRLEDGRWLDVLDARGSPQGVDVLLGTVEVREPTYPPTTAALSIQRPQRADFSPGVRFLGYSLRGERFRAGDALEMSLFWQALEDLEEEYHFCMTLQAGAGHAWASLEAPLATSAFPTDEWSAGQLVRGIHNLVIPAQVPSGKYRLVLSLIGAGDGRLLPLRRFGLNWGHSHFLGEVEVRGRPHRTERPASIEHPMSLRLGEAVHFLGYDLDRQELSPGDTLRLTLYWEAVSEMGISYTVFNHLIDSADHIWGQKDNMPGGGSLPTSSWIAGEYIVDAYDIPVREDTPSGEYLLETGMYDLRTMVRVPVSDAQGRMIGDRILLEATPIVVR